VALGLLQVGTTELIQFFLLLHLQVVAVVVLEFQGLVDQLMRVKQVVLAEVLLKVVLLVVEIVLPFLLLKEITEVLQPNLEANQVLVVVELLELVVVYQGLMDQEALVAQEPLHK
jgi:hypothetical protein